MSADTGPLLNVERATVEYPLQAGVFRRALNLRAVDGVSFALRAGETLGVVGESGSGKSSLARAILKLLPLRAGQISWLGRPLAALSRAELHELRAHLQVVFQDPLASLNPCHTVLEIVGEPLRIFRPALSARERAAHVRAMLQQVGLPGDVLHRYPHEFSGGQCQRIAIARAVILRPRLLVCDEPVSSLDVSMQAQIVNLLLGLQRELGLAMVFISHNLALVRVISQRVLVMYLGRMMELAPRERLFTEPAHPYTRALLAAAPGIDPERERERKRAVLTGEIASALDPPSGCVFRTRCPHALARCAQDVPAVEIVAPGHEVACLRWRELPPP